MGRLTRPPSGWRRSSWTCPRFAGAFGRRLHAAGVPMTPGRLTDLARALALVRPISRRRLYWTARAVLVSDPTQVAAFDRVFRAVFGDRRVR